MNFRKDQKVVCIDDAWDIQSGRSYPVKGRVYTVAGSTFNPDNSHLFFVRFHEIPHAEGAHHAWWFAACYFRPVVEPGMEILNAILINTKAPARKDERVFDPALGVTKFIPKRTVPAS